MRIKNVFYGCMFTVLLFVKPVLGQTDEIITRFAFVEIYNRVKNSVVTLKVEGNVLVEGRPKTVSGFGSGVVWDRDGHIITNKHVLQEDAGAGGQTVKRRSSRVFIVLQSGLELRAKIIGVAPDTDIALVKVENSSPELTPMVLGDSVHIMIGEPVLALGAPFGFGGTLTKGIVSSIRTAGLDGAPLPHQMIQTDAAINPGNSGGALINLEGELIGIPTVIVSQTGTNTGVGFAIPVNVAKKIVEDIKNKKIALGYLGIKVQDIGELAGTIKKQLGITDKSGVVVTGLDAGGPAEKAGILQGDLILSINNEPIENVTGSNGFKWLERNLNPGQEVVVKVKRRMSGKIEDIKVKAGEAAVP